MIRDEMAHLQVRVTPGARESSIGPWDGETLRVKVREPAEKGRATEAAARLLAEHLGVPSGAVILKRGATARQKLFEVEGLDSGEVRRRLGAAMI
jgi:uncharacterized protein YggU (UPF0235/DUF167 family)